MEMLLIGLCVSVFGVAVVALGFHAATRAEVPKAAVPAEFSAVEASATNMMPTRVSVSAMALHAQIPIDLLLLQIENHVRLERAAAESYIGYPSQTLLHSKTTSTFVN